VTGRFDDDDFVEKIATKAKRPPCVCWAIRDDLPPLSAAAFKVLVVIAQHADPDGSNAWPSVETIARRAQVVNRRTVRRAIAELEDLGLLIVGRNEGGPAHVRADRRPNLYRVIKPPTDEGAPAPSCLAREGQIDTTGGSKRTERAGLIDTTGGSGDPPTMPYQSLDHSETIPSLSEPKVVREQFVSNEEAQKHIGEIKGLLNGSVRP
jgi:hypothetical protein